MTRIRFRRGAATTWSGVNPVLGPGEPGVEVDTGRFKFGNGATPWGSLPYAKGDISEGDARFVRATSLTALGADPTGGDVDARPALDAVLLQAVQNRVAIGNLPMGRYRLKSTYNPSDQSADHPARVLPGNMRGFTWFGGWGKIGNTLSGGNKIYAAPEIVWFGTAGGIMWEFDSLTGAAILGVCFRGKGAVPRAGIGLNVSQRGSIVGSGVHLLDRVSFIDMAVGVKFGEGQLTGGGNCDTTTFRDVSWQSCDVGVLLSHQQNLVYNFDGTSAFGDCPTLIRASAGGYLNINDLNANGCGGTDTSSWMLDFAGGKNIGTHKISRARIEGNCKQLLKVRSRYTEVLFEGLTEAQDPQGVTMFDLTGGQVTLVGGKLSSHDVNAPTFKLHQDVASGGSPSLRLYGVRLDAQKFLYEEWFTHDSNSTPHITVRDCEDQYGRHIPSFSTRLEDRLPVPLRARTTDGTTTVTATLMGNGADQRTDNCCAVEAGAYRVRVTIIARNADTGALQVRAVREADVVHTGTSLSMSAPDVIGTDVNPDSLAFSVGAVNSYKYLRAVVQGKAATILDWRAEFQLVGGLSAVTTA